MSGHTSTDGRRHAGAWALVGLVAVAVAIAAPVTPSLGKPRLPPISR